MKIKLSALLNVMLLFAYISPADADSMVQVFACDLKEGNTRTELMEVTAAWVKATKSMDGGKGIETHVEFPLASDDISKFRFVLVADSGKTWGTFVDSFSALGDAYEGSPIAKADEAWNELASCSSSSLWNSVKIE